MSEHTSMGSRWVGLLAAVLLSSGLAVVSGSAAQAAQSDCNARRETVIKDWAPDDYRVVARCTHVAGGTEVRGFLNMLGCCDKETAWFSTINKDYYSAYASGNYEGVGINSRSV